jgi:hypothetical protein
MFPNKDDAWYAAKMMQVVNAPLGSLNTFSSTEIKFLMVAESADNPKVTQVRKGMFVSKAPELLKKAPDLSKIIKPGHRLSFEHIRAIVEVQGANASHFLKYDVSIKRHQIEHFELSHTLENSITELCELYGKNSYILVGDEKLWEVSLINFIMERIQKSLPDNLLEFHAEPNLAESLNPKGVLQDWIEDAFWAVRSGKMSMAALLKLLQDSDSFLKYEDRFYALLNQ